MGGGVFFLMVRCSDPCPLGIVLIILIYMCLRFHVDVDVRWIIKDSSQEYMGHIIAVLYRDHNRDQSVF